MQPTEERVARKRQTAKLSTPQKPNFDSTAVCSAAAGADDGNAADYLRKGRHAPYPDKACLLDRVQPGAVEMRGCGLRAEQVAGATKHAIL